MVTIVDLFRIFRPRTAVSMPHGDKETKECRIYPAPESGCNAAAVREISLREVGRLKQYPLFVDVRGEAEYLLGHIEGARNICRALLEQTVPDMFPDRARAIVVYGKEGKSSALAVEALEKLGYREVFSLKGGLLEWLEAGGVLETSHKR